MVLKNYQQQAIASLERFLTLLETMPLKVAYQKLLEEQEYKSTAYQETISGVPQVCFKVPTGGGKTFMAAASIKPIYKKFPSRIIVWIVPSDTILTQTYQNLNDANHPYREKITRDFNGNVRIYTKEQLLAGENFSPIEVDNQISILVLSYDSFRKMKKDSYKVFQENSHFENFSAQINEEDRLEEAAENSLINTIRSYKPIVIVDESHHATTNLSVEMLQNFNPSFILELTATPKQTSNVICYVPARQLKDEGMIKIPLIVYNQHARGDVMRQAISYRNALEKLGADEKVRPIVLFQAESKGKENRDTFDKIRERLITNFHIPAEEIAIKTATINELKGVDLMSEDCQIRYIITINALKEGWDCPFAYILASLANRNSAVDVEQIIGRIMRRPYTKTFSKPQLNLSYVFTASDDFRKTLEVVANGLNSAGFSEEDYRAVEELEELVVVPDEVKESPAKPAEKIIADDTQIDDVDEEVVAKVTANILTTAANEDKKYINSTAPKVEVKEKSVENPMNEFPMQKEFQDTEEILLPQFYLRGEKILLFGENDDVKISKEVLCKDTSLVNDDTKIDFEELHKEIAAYDFYGKQSDNLTYKYLYGENVKAFMEHFDSLPTAGQIRQCVGVLTKIINNHKDFPATKIIREYVTRVVETFDRDRIRDAVQNREFYARRIEAKIESLLEEHAAESFARQVDAKKIFAKPTYKLPSTITPLKFTRNMSKSLYTAEPNDMNQLEYKIISRVSALDNVRWWHRNRAKKEFFINGFINHYPDFLIMMDSGVLLIVEVKGDDRDNSDSKRKLKLGKLWESKADSDKYSYFMVFDKNPFEGALDFNDFLTRIKYL